MMGHAMVQVVMWLALQDSLPFLSVAFANPPDSAPANLADPAASFAAVTMSTDELLNLRDPFRRPSILDTKGPPKSELESVPLESIKMIGVSTGPEKSRAVLQLPGGKTYLVSESTRIGPRNGVVTKITFDRILIKEKVKNLLGITEEILTYIPLVEESGGGGSAIVVNPGDGNPPQQKAGK